MIEIEGRVIYMVKEVKSYKYILTFRISLFLLLFFNILDYFFTLLYLDRGYREVNLLIDTIINKSPVLFTILKLIFTPTLIFLLAREEEVLKIINSGVVLCFYLLVFNFYLILIIYYTWSYRFS